MADINLSNLFGVPSGGISGRPSNPSIGQTYYNGELGYQEIYTASGWIPASGGNDFNLNITDTYTAITFTQSYAAGSYSISSGANDTTLDIYAIASDGSLAGYTNTKSITISQRFNKIVVIGGTPGDVISFSYKTTYSTTINNSSTTAGPYITSISPSAMPNKNDTVTITGGNFASDVTVNFTGSGYSSTPAKSIVRSSSSQLIVTRPDNFPISSSPYTVTLSNPGINNPSGTNANISSNSITAGVSPVWNTSSIPVYAQNIAYSTTLSATDADAGGSISYSIVSGSLVSGLSLNSSTGVISGTPTVTTTATFTIRATDAGGNYVDRAFSHVCGFIKTGTTTYSYLGSAINDISEIESTLFQIFSGSGVYYLKYPINNASSGTSTVNVACRKDTTNNLIAQSSFSLFGATFAQQGSYYGVLAGSANTPDDHDTLIMLADGTNLLNFNNTNSWNTAGTNTRDWAISRANSSLSTRPPGNNSNSYPLSTVLGSSHDVAVAAGEVGGNATIITFNQTGTYCFVDMTNSRIKVGQKAWQAFDSNLNTYIGTGVTNNQILTVTDGVNGFLIYRYGQPYAVRVRMNLSTGAIISTALQSFSAAMDATNNTEEDAFGDVLYAVDSGISYYQSNTFKISDMPWTSASSMTSGNLSSAALGTRNTQTGYDVFGSIDSGDNSVWFADWGHDGPSLWGETQDDQQLTVAKTNIKLIATTYTN